MTLLGIQILFLEYDGLWTLNFVLFDRLQAQVTRTKLTMVTMVDYSSLFSHSASLSRKLGVKPPLLSYLLNWFKVISPLILLRQFKAVSPLSPLLNRFKAASPLSPLLNRFKDVSPLILLSQFSPLILLSRFKATSPLILPWSEFCPDYANHSSSRLQIDPLFILGVFYGMMHFHLLLRQTGPLLFLSPKILHSAIQLYLLPSQVRFLFSSFGVFNLVILHLRFKTGPSLWFRVPFISEILSLLHLNEPFSPRFLQFYVLFIAAIHSFLHANGSLLLLLLWLEVSSILKASSFLHAKLRSLWFSWSQILFHEGLKQSSKISSNGHESTTNGTICFVRIKPGTPVYFGTDNIGTTTNDAICFTIQVTIWVICFVRIEPGTICFTIQVTI